MELLLSIWNSASLFHTNQISLLGTAITALMTLLTMIVTAIVGIQVAFRQQRHVFHHKVIYEGWRDFQEKLFKLTRAFTMYSTEVQSLKYFLDSQDNPLVNGGNLQRHRTEKWRALSDSNIKLQMADVDFLRSFEANQVIFHRLNRMKKLYCKEFRDLISGAAFLDFSEAIFPEMYGSSHITDINQLKELIDLHWKLTLDLETYLEDFRIEIQNETIGRVLGVHLAHRVPDKGMRILTRYGFKLQRRQPRRLPEDT